MYTKFLGFAVALAIAVFTLGYANPSFADNPNTGGCKPIHCPHGNTEGDQTTFTVEIETNIVGVDNGFDGVDTTGNSHGTSHDEVGCEGVTNNGKLSVDFFTNSRVDCGHVAIIHHVNATFDIYLYQIPVKETNKKTTVDFFFVTCVKGGVCGNEFVYHTGPLLAEITRNSDGIPTEITGIEGSWSNVVLTKSHQPFKGELSTEATAISIGKMVYTPTSTQSF